MVTVHEIQNPQGIELPISKLQNVLKNKLGWVNVDIYNRAFKVEAEGNIIPQAYTGNGEYAKDVLTLELGNNKVFFLTSNKAKVLPGGQMEQLLKIVFILDLKTLYPSLGHRADMEAQAHALSVVKMEPLFKNIEEVETDLPSVMKGFYLGGKAKLLDIHPRHIFSINTNVKYFSTKQIYCNC